MISSAVAAHHLPNADRFVMKHVHHCHIDTAGEHGVVTVMKNALTSRLDCGREARIPRLSHCQGFAG